MHCKSLNSIPGESFNVYDIIYYFRLVIPGCFGSELITTFRSTVIKPCEESPSKIKMWHLHKFCNLAGNRGGLGPPSNHQWLSNRAWVTDFSDHDSVCKFSSQALAQLFLLLLQKSYIIIQLKFLQQYFCAPVMCNITRYCTRVLVWALGYLRPQFLLLQLPCPLIGMRSHKLLAESFSDCKQTINMQKTNKD